MSPHGVSSVTVKHKQIAAQRSELLARLPATDQIIRGSLLKRTIRHRQGCPKCARGEGHPAWVLTVSYPGGATKQISIRAEQRALVEQWLCNYHDLRAKLEQVCELNHELLRSER